MEKKKFKKKYPNKNNTNKILQDEVVYTTPVTGPVKKADWQLKLIAISDCYSEMGKDNFTKLVEERYSYLKSRNK